MNQVDKQYNDLVKTILDEGFWHDANGMYYLDGTMPRVKKITQVTMRYDLQKELPLLTTKRMGLNKGPLQPIKEAIWIYVLGSNYVPDLQNMGVKIWNEWMKKDGTIGKAYGWQVRHWEKHIFDNNGHFIETVQIDQVEKLIKGLKENPYSRRHIINMWNVADLDEMALEPCAFMTLWDVTDGYLNMTLIQRSADVGLGLPFNMIQYATLCHMVASVTNLKPGHMLHVINNAHIYDRHIEPLQEQIKRKPFDLATLEIDNSIKNFNDFKPEHFKFINYQSHDKVEMEIAIHTHPDNLIIKSK